MVTLKTIWDLLDLKFIFSLKSVIYLNIKSTIRSITMHQSNPDFYSTTVVGGKRTTLDNSKVYSKINCFTGLVDVSNF